MLTFSFTTYGIQIQGTLTVEEAAVTLDGTLPFAAIAFKGKIESSLSEELRKALSTHSKRTTNHIHPIEALTWGMIYIDY